MKDGSLTDQLGDVVGYPQMSAFDGLGLHSTGYGSVRKASIIRRFDGQKKSGVNC